MSPTGLLESIRQSFRSVDSFRSPSDAPTTRARKTHSFRQSASAASPSNGMDSASVPAEEMCADLATYEPDVRHHEDDDDVFDYFGDDDPGSAYEYDDDYDFDEPEIWEFETLPDDAREADMLAFEDVARGIVDPPTNGIDAINAPGESWEDSFAGLIAALETLTSMLPTDEPETTAPPDGERGMEPVLTAPAVQRQRSASTLLDQEPEASLPQLLRTVAPVRQQLATLIDERASAVADSTASHQVPVDNKPAIESPVEVPVDAQCDETVVTAKMLSAERARPFRDLFANPDHLRRLLMVGLVGLCGLLIVAKLRPAPSPAKLNVPAASSDSAVLADDLASAVSGGAGITSAVASYVPGIGVVMHVSATNVSREGITDWWSKILEPIAPKFASSVTEDRLVAVVDVGGADSFSRSIIAPLTSMADPSSYRLTASTGVFTQRAGTVESPTRAVEASANPTTAAPTPAPSTAAPSMSPPATSAPTTTPAATGQAVDQAAAVAPVTAPATTAAAPSGAAPTAAAPLGGTTDHFDIESSDWVPMAGQWKFVAGTYQQLDNSGFDFISQRAGSAPAKFSMHVKLKATEGNISGGLIVLQPQKGKRNGASVIDVTDNNTYLRWGHYESTGTYAFDGGAKLATPLDPLVGAVIGVEVIDGKASVVLDGKRIGEFTPFSTTGTLGLVSSQAKLTFDDFTVTPL